MAKRKRKTPSPAPSSTSFSSSSQESDDSMVAATLTSSRATWRTLSTLERDTLTSMDGDLFQIINQHLSSTATPTPTPALRSNISNTLTSLFHRIDTKLSTTLVPTIPRHPFHSRTELPSSLLNSLDQDIAELQPVLLGETTQLLDLSNTLQEQESILTHLETNISQLKKKRKLLKIQRQQQQLDANQSLASSLSSLGKRSPNTKAIDQKLNPFFTFFHK